MATSFGALCTDFYINQKLALKMDLPSDRETVLHLFDGVRKTIPIMDRFRRFNDELALESSRRDARYQWLALKRNSLRTGFVNPESMADAYDFHRLILEVSPYHLTVSALDVDYLEVLFGFDLECRANHDEIVFEALYGQSPLANLTHAGDMRTLDVQPVYGFSLSRRGDTQAYFEVKTRTRSRRGKDRYRNEPISLFLTLRQYGPIEKIEDLQKMQVELSQKAEQLAADHLVPDLLTPIARQISASSH